MAIIIPSSKTYDRQNPKVRDNVIERIEVKAREVLPNNEYETPVYNEDIDFSTYESKSDTAVLNEDAVAHNQGAETTRNIRGACGLKYVLNFVSIPEILIPKIKNNEYISKIYDDLDEEGNSRIKIGLRVKQTNYSGNSSYQPSSNTFDFASDNLTKEETEKENIFYGFENFKWIKDISSTVSSLRVSSVYSLTANHSIVEENGKLKISSYIYADSNYNWSPNAITVDDYIDADLFSNAISVTSETINGVEYYKLLGTKVLIGMDTTFMSCLIESAGSFSNVSGYARAVATRVLQECQELTITVYGNTIGIDLTDKTVYINGEMQKKVHSVEGNELMQTSNYEEKETELVENIDYWVGKSSTSSQTYFYTSVHLYNEYPFDTYVEYTTPSGTTGTAVIKAFATTHSPAIESTGGYVTINRVYRPLTSTTYECFKQTQEDYENGKETATIRCSIGDYFDYDSGEKLISIDNSTGKMSFNIGDEVVPMVFGADGNDTPMSLTSSGRPKKFSVLGSKIYYDGAVWQEISLQEGAETFYSIKYLSGGGVNQNGDNGYKFDVKGQGIIYLKKVDGGLHWLADINSPNSIQEVIFLLKELQNITTLEQHLDASRFFANFVFKGTFSQVSTGDNKLAGAIGKVGIIESVYSYDGLAGATYVEMFHYGDINAYTTFPSHIVKVSTKTFYYAENPTNLLTIPKTIKTIESLAFGYSEITKIKFLHGKKDKINLPTAGSVSGMFYSKDAKTMTIYTDNLTIKNYDWVTDNITPTFLHIDGTEWE